MVFSGIDFWQTVRVSSMDDDPDCIDLEEKTLPPLDNPFGPESVNDVFAMCGSQAAPVR